MKKYIEEEIEVLEKNKKKLLEKMEDITLPDSLKKAKELLSVFNDVELQLKKENNELLIDCLVQKLPLLYLQMGKI